MKKLEVENFSIKYKNDLDELYNIQSKIDKMVIKFKAEQEKIDKITIVKKTKHHKNGTKCGLE